MGGMICCAKCRERFTLLPDTESVLRRTGQTFHCPWGHELFFPRDRPPTFYFPVQAFTIPRGEIFIAT